MDASAESLLHRVQTLEAQLQAVNAELQRLKSGAPAHDGVGGAQDLGIGQKRSQQESQKGLELPLALDEYERYGRQLIMPEIGLQGQLHLKSSRVLLVGAGGLGCPAAAYLAGAGVGTLGIVDGDTVETSNLHRQILHTASGVGTLKAESVQAYVKSLNPLVNCRAHTHHLSASNAIGIFTQYDLVLDCTDNPASRYLISDAAILLGKPLVSASALRTEGQIILLNHPVGAPGCTGGGPCYRCVFPNPPPPDTVTTCGEGGILGPVVGVMGIMQALEAIKVLANGITRTDNGLANGTKDPPRASLLVFSAFDASPFRTFKLRGRRRDCPACSSQATISATTFAQGSDAYLQLCSAALPVKVLQDCERIRPSELASRLESKPNESVIVDVREKAHFDVFSLPGSINIPYSSIMADDLSADFLQQNEQLAGTHHMFVLCRLGNDSQHAVRKFKALGLDNGGRRSIVDVAGGWQAWRRDVPGRWPNV